MTQSDLVAGCIAKTDDELSLYQKNFKAEGLDILGPDGDMYAAMREAHAVFTKLLNQGLSENQMNAVLNADSILETTARAYVRNPMIGLSGEKNVAMQMIDNAAIGA